MKLKKSVVWAIFFTLIAFYYSLSLPNYLKPMAPAETDKSARVYLETLLSEEGLHLESFPKERVDAAAKLYQKNYYQTVNRVLFILSVIISIFAALLFWFNVQQAYVLGVIFFITQNILALVRVLRYYEGYRMSWLLVQGIAFPFPATDAEGWLFLYKNGLGAFIFSFLMLILLLRKKQTLPN